MGFVCQRKRSDRVYVFETSLWRGFFDRAVYCSYEDPFAATGIDHFVCTISFSDLAVFSYISIPGRYTALLYASGNEHSQSSNLGMFQIIRGKSGNVSDDGSCICTSCVRGLHVLYRFNYADLNHSQLVSRLWWAETLVALNGIALVSSTSLLNQYCPIPSVNPPASFKDCFHVRETRLSCLSFENHS